MKYKRGGLVYCTEMKEILNVYSGKEADCLKVFLQAVNIWKLFIEPHNDCRRRKTCTKIYSLAYFYHWKSPQSLPHLLDNVNKTWGHFLALPFSQFVSLITFERPLPLCSAIKVAPYGYSLFVLRALVSTILGNLPITLSCISLEPIEIKFWEIKLPFWAIT